MKLITLLVSLLAIGMFISQAQAVVPVGGTNPARGGSQGGITLTKYSAECKLDVDNNGNGIGGKNESPSGYKPLDWTLEKRREIVLTAVPQEGGTSGLFGKCFKILSDGIDPNQVFFAGDRYGTGSNNQNKIDISVECTDEVKKFKMDAATIEEVPCPSGQAAPTS